jgi:hypothetical protein
MGAPKGFAGTPPRQVLIYDQGVVVLEDGKVVSVKVRK